MYQFTQIFAFLTKLFDIFWKDCHLHFNRAQNFNGFKQCEVLLGYCWQMNWQLASSVDACRLHRMSQSVCVCRWKIIYEAFITVNDQISQFITMAFWLRFLAILRHFIVESQFLTATGTFLQRKSASTMRTHSAHSKVTCSNFARTINQSNCH